MTGADATDVVVTGTGATAAPAAVYLYRVRAQRDPALLPRVLEYFACQNLIPNTVVVSSTDDDGFVIDLACPMPDGQRARIICAKLAQIVTVTDVAMARETG